MIRGERCEHCMAAASSSTAEQHKPGCPRRNAAARMASRELFGRAKIEESGIEQQQNRQTRPNGWGQPAPRTPVRIPNPFYEDMNLRGSQTTGNTQVASN